MKTLKCLLVSLAIVACHSALAAGDAAAGAEKASLCAACHGPEGVSVNPLWPSLAGQQPVYLANQIKAFRDGARQDPTMQPFVTGLSDQDAEDLAAHFSSLKNCGAAR